MSTSFIYDTAGRLARRRDVIGAYVFDSQYEYDGNDQIVAITYPTGRVVNYERNDPEGRMTRVFETAAGRDYAFGMTYHPSGALASYTAGNNIATIVTYDPARYWVQSINAGPLGLTYDDYDGAGNVRTIGDSRGSGWRQSFTYDALHRLSAATGPWGSTNYAYDSHGNRQTRIRHQLCLRRQFAASDGAKRSPVWLRQQRKSDQFLHCHVYLHSRELARHRLDHEWSGELRV